MGTRKTNLMRGDRYGLMKAAELSAELIGEYERARNGALKVRVECADEERWDDIEVVHIGRTDRWQVKRVKQKLTVSEASELLTPMFSSGLQDTNYILGVAAFVPVMPDSKADSKALFNLRDLGELCNQARTPGIDATLFAQREKNNRALQFITQRHPKGADTGAILATLQQLHVQELGMEDALRSRACGHLREFFLNADDIFGEIHSWFIKNPDATIVVDAGLLYNNVVDRVAKRDPARPLWIHLSRDQVNVTWASHGPLAHDRLVEIAWELGSGRVQVGAPPFSGEAVSSALVRLALHRVQGVALESATNDAVGWTNHAALLCGGTLGKSPTQPQCAWQASPMSRPAHLPCCEIDTPTFAALLNEAMDRRVWSGYVDAVSRHLVERNIAADLQPKMQSIWTAWHSCLDADPSRRASFLRAMLATVEEWGRKGFDRSARVGFSIVEELARATIVAVAIATAFDEGGVSSEIGATGSITNLRFGGVGAHVVALASASHPEDRKPCRVADATGAMLAPEAGIAILGVIEASAIEIFDLAVEDTVPFHASDNAAQNFRHPGLPPPVLTASPTFVAALAKGTDAVKKHLSEVLSRMNDRRVESLRRALKGATSNG